MSIAVILFVRLVIKYYCDGMFNVFTLYMYITNMPVNIV